jgi:hypothetical protein
MRNRLICFSIAACLVSLAGPFASFASARGRSFPIEVTGIIRSIDRSSQTFTLEADDPATALNIGLRYDCKFLQRGGPAGVNILKRDAHVKVSYFATIFTGNLAVEIEASPEAEVVCGVIERIEPLRRQLTLQLNRDRCFVVRWTANALFTNRGRAITPAKLREGTAVKVSYYSPAFESKYAVKVEAQPPF